VGDAWSDLLAGQSAGLQGTILVRTGRGSSQLGDDQPAEIRPFFISDDLFDAFKTITNLATNIP
jgi:ribonucleotide monophosphatase NagD (HAD superfamily)